MKKLLRIVHEKIRHAVHENLKLITFILFMGGLWAALIATYPFLNLYSWYTAKYLHGFREFINDFSLCITALLGYYIWIGWFFITFRGGYLWTTRRTFWILSLINHTAWLIWLFSFCEWQDGLFSWECAIPNVWIAVNIVVALLAMETPLNQERGDEADADDEKNLHLSVL